MQLIPYVSAEEVLRKSLAASKAVQTKAPVAKNGYLFSEAKPEDVEAIVAIVNEAFRTTYPFRKVDADRTNTADVTKEVQEPGNMRWYVLKSKGDTAGKDGATIKAGQVVSALLYTAESETSGYLNMVAAHAAVRGTGIGTQLLKEILKSAVKSHKEQVSLWCVDDPKLVGYYKKFGFVKTDKSGIYDSAYVKPEFAGKIKICEMRNGFTHMTAL